MAVVLKKQFDLLSLQAALRLEGSVQKVDLLLEYYARDDDPLLESWTLDAATLQLDPQESPLSSLTAPAPERTDEKVSPSPALIQLGTHVANAIGAAQVPGDDAVWLHLVKPYGWLGTLPWEAALEQTTQRPVFRLPDFLERARENPATLDVAVCCDLPDGTENVTQIERVVKAILDGSPRTQTHVLVFAQAGNSRALKSKFTADSRVWVAPPPSVRTGPNTPASPWLASIEQALRERAADAVHFICRAAVVGGRASLRLADPGGTSAPGPARFHSTGEISAFLARIGAWGAIFTPAKAEADNRMRWFADTLAQTRPGAVLFDGGGDLAPLYRFLFAPSPTTPPRLGSSFMYCQPSLAISPDDPASKTELLKDPAFSRIVALGQNAHLFLDVAAKASANPTLERLASAAGTVMSVFPAIGELIGLRAPIAPSGPGATPTWLAAAQRYVEAQSLEIVRSRSKDPFLRDLVQRVTLPGSGQMASNPAQAGADVVDKTLNELQSIIAMHAAKGE